MSDSESFPASFAEFIAPMAERDFFESYYLQQPLLLKARTHASKRPMFGPQDLIALVGCSEANSSDNESVYRFVRQGQNLPDMFLSAKARQPASKWFPGLFAEGWTILANHLQRWSIPCHALCAQLVAAAKTDVWANVYYTPAASQGFPFHGDPHHVFIVQEWGCKHWRVWERGARPEDTPLIETELRAGEVLYIPKDFPHEARSGEGEDSLHITVGFYSQWSFLKKLLVRRAIKWSSSTSDVSPHFLEGSEEPLTIENMQRAGELFQNWLEEDLRSNEMETLAIPTSGRAVDEVLDDLDRLSATDTLEFIGQPQFNGLRDRFRDAMSGMAAGAGVELANLPLEESEAVDLARLLIGSGTAVLA